MAVAEVRERLSVSQRRTQKFNIKRRDLKGSGVMELYEAKFLNRLEVMGSLDDYSGVNLASEYIRVIPKFSANSLIHKESTQYKKWN